MTLDRVQTQQSGPELVLFPLGKSGGRWEKAAHPPPALVSPATYLPARAARVGPAFPHCDCSLREAGAQSAWGPGNSPLRGWLLCPVRLPPELEAGPGLSSVGRNTGPSQKRRAPGPALLPLAVRLRANLLSHRVLQRNQMASINSKKFYKLFWQNVIAKFR